MCGRGFQDTSNPALKGWKKLRHSFLSIQRFLKKLKIELPYDPTIPLLCMYLEKKHCSKDTCSPMFIAALFSITKTWKQPKCPSTHEWTKKMWYIYTMEYYSEIGRASCRERV